MKSECERIADQLRRAFQGEAWHGPALREVLDGLTPAQAVARPLTSMHSIWELVLHIRVWTQAALDSIHGKPMPSPIAPEQDWPPVPQATPAAWQAARLDLMHTGADLASAIENFQDRNLASIVPGRNFDFYFLLHGVVQHSLYHAGQIALLRKAIPA